MAPQLEDGGHARQEATTPHGVHKLKHVKEGRVLLTQEQVEALAAALWAAERDAAPIAPLTAQHPDMTVADAYAVQQTLIRRKLAAGAHVVGWKVGLTSAAMQRLLGVEEPDFGHLLDTMQLADGATLQRSALIWPRVEPEIAFVLGADLRGPGVTVADVLAATAALLPALEVVDSRIRDWQIRLADTIADNASSSRFVLGRGRVPPGDVDLRLLGMVFQVDGQVVATAAGAAVLGHPAQAVAWLANTLASFGQSLRAGQVVLPGSLVAAVDVQPGMTVTAEFDRLGPVTLHVTA